MELSTYFRINAKNTGQFERTLIIADKGAYVSYLEGCTAPMRDENQLHAAVVELVALDDAEIKYSTVQNWYPGDKEGKGGIYNFVTKRGDCRGARSKISWTQVETGSAITWKYPSCILRGDDSQGEFYSIAVTNNRQQADTGTKMIHLGKNTRAASSPRASRRGGATTPIAAWSRCTARRRGRAQLHAVRLAADRRQVRRAHRALHREQERLGQFEHEATTSKISDDQLFYCRSAASQRGGSGGADRQRLRAATCCRSCRWSSRSRRRKAPSR
jgi:Fe-S cluster assembly protein SufB